MIQQYRLVLTDSAGQRLPSFWGYRLYAWLLEQVEEEWGEMLHLQGETPISQYLHWDADAQENVWVINLLCEPLIQVLGSVLENAKELTLHTGLLRVCRCEKDEILTAETFIAGAKTDMGQGRILFEFSTPTAFKQAGRYTIFPSEALLLQSLISKWDVAFPEYPLQDEDAFQALLNGVHIVDYNLRTTRYPLKNIKIPSFYGRIALECRLPIPMRELLQTLVNFAPYAGVGVKTTLGMGGVVVPK